MNKTLIQQKLGEKESVLLKPQCLKYTYTQYANKLFEFNKYNFPLFMYTYVRVFTKN